jgi:hypothetical protein
LGIGRGALFARVRIPNPTACGWPSKLDSLPRNTREAPRHEVAGKRRPQSLEPTGSFCDTFHAV